METIKLRAGVPGTRQLRECGSAGGSWTQCDCCPRNSRYGYLDGLRGIAAVLVVIYHIGGRFGGIQMVPNGYLAVDFFFILSGVVLASAYERPLIHNLSWRRFCSKRVQRLFPMAVVGVAIGTAYLYARLYVDPARSDGVAQITGAALLNLCLLPKFWWGTATHGETFPNNGALWSLFFEMIANLAWAAWLPQARSATLVVLMLAGAALFLMCALINDTPGVGWSVHTLWGGLGRVTFGFLCGVLIYRERARFRRMPHILPWLAPLILVFFTCFDGGPLVWPLLGALVAMPIAVIAGMTAGSRRILPAEGLLGRLSYPVYAIHFPLLMVFSGIRMKLLPHAAINASAVALVIPIVALAYCLMRFFDEPFRRNLARTFD